MASITTGKLGHAYNSERSGTRLSERRLKLYNRLLKESAGKPSTPFEFVPVVIEDEEIIEKLDKFGWNFEKFSIYDNGVYYTNLRNYINTFSPLLKEIKETKDFKIIVGRVPIKVISHLRTHRAFSFLVESSRNKKYLNEVEFWYPSWWHPMSVYRIKNRGIDLLNILQEDLDEKDITPEEATMELSDRRLVTFAMAAWKQNTNAWDNLFAVRGHKTGTMSITGETVESIKTLVNYI